MLSCPSLIGRRQHWLPCGRKAAIDDVAPFFIGFGMRFCFIMGQSSPTVETNPWRPDQVKGFRLLRRLSPCRRRNDSVHSECGHDTAESSLSMSNLKVRRNQYYWSNYQSLSVDGGETAKTSRVPSRYSADAPICFTHKGAVRLRKGLTHPTKLQNVS